MNIYKARAREVVIGGWTPGALWSGCLASLVSPRLMSNSILKEVDVYTFLKSSALHNKFWSMHIHAGVHTHIKLKKKNVPSRKDLF